jgi:hypothetical protein
MTGGSPWAAPPESGQQQAPVYPPPPASVPPQSGPPVPPAAPPPHPTRRGLPWLLVGGAVIVLIAVIAATAAVTYAVARNSEGPNATPPTARTAQAQQFTAAEQATAKDRVCAVFDTSLRGQEGQGGLRLNGDLNIPVMVRRLNSVVAVQNALTTAVPEDVTEAARKFIDTSLDVTTAATKNVPTDEGNRLNDTANKAIFAFADVCGLPH